ncbi:S41 family peptidase [Candidatus Falkowbacteria bacterium]|nr:S41 family peptidase [Candidatus Falkowbacteria bacterium]
MRRINGKIFVTFVVVALLIIFTGAGFVLGRITEGKIEFEINPELYKATPLPEIFSNTVVQQVWNIIQTEYVDKDKIDQREIFYGALRGLVSGLGDPHSAFLDPVTTMEFDQAMAGAFEGIGAELAMKNNVATVVAPLPGTPAEKAGLRPGDKILAVDGEQVVGLPLEKVVRKIRGPGGTNVALLIMRGDEEPFEVVITRATIEIKSVKWAFRDDGLFYLKLNGFNGDTSDLLNKAAKEIKQKKAGGIILDLRNNPGGLLDTAIDVASFWIEDKLILTEKFGGGQQVNYRSSKKAMLKDFPTIVLINEGSASASEIVAGALQDYKKAMVLGATSFGKGSVQALHKLPDGSSVKITVAKWLTPNGRSINDGGIKPDLEIKITKEDVENQKDPQLEKAVEVLLKNKK